MSHVTYIKIVIQEQTEASLYLTGTNRKYLVYDICQIFYWEALHNTVTIYVYFIF